MFFKRHVKNPQRALSARKSRSRCCKFCLTGSQSSYCTLFCKRPLSKVGDAKIKVADGRQVQTCMKRIEASGVNAFIY